MAVSGFSVYESPCVSFSSSNRKFSEQSVPTCYNGPYTSYKLAKHELTDKLVEV